MHVSPQANHGITGPPAPHAVPAAPQATGRSDQRALVRLRLGLMFWLIGFAAGFMFWQYVGFWGLIQSVFYAGGSADRTGPERTVRMHSDPSGGAVGAGPQASGMPSSIGLLSVKLSAEHCTSLVLDRLAQTLVSTACDDAIMALNSLRAARKDDRRIPVAEAKAAANAASAASAATVAKPKMAPGAPAVASWSSTVVTSPPR